MIKFISRICILAGALLIGFQSWGYVKDWIDPPQTIVAVNRTIPRLEPLKRHNQKTSYSEYDKVAALTFDDGPNPEYTRTILDLLDQYHIKGTFFVLGQNAEQYPEIVKEISDRGHILGSHSYSHLDLSNVDPALARQEILQAAEVIQSITSQPVSFYRLPYGAGNQMVIDQVPEMTSILWNVDSEDWRIEQGNAVYKNVQSQLTGNDLLLFHDRLPQTVQALEQLIPEMLEEGYFFDSPDKIDFEMRFF